MFVAAAVRVDEGLVHCIGRWRERTGPNYALVHWSNDRAYTWASAEIKSIRWLEPAAIDLDAESVAFP